LYNDIRSYVEQAFLHDFNLVIEEFPFYQELTPKMQTTLIEKTKVFNEFEKHFKHFFDECERGFTNEVIINLFCRFQKANTVVQGYKSHFKELYFIRQGIVEVHNNEHDYDSDRDYKDETQMKKEFQKNKRQPVLYLPKYSYFGDYQILLNLRSNLEFRTHMADGQDEKDAPDILFMCCDSEVLNGLCELFP
jgi:hypothetical protein